MDLSNYQNQELKDVIVSVTVQSGKAKDSGNPYNYIQIRLNNGYEKRLFLNNEERFAWLDAFSKNEEQPFVS